jgi:hypothetical protein
VILGTMAAAGAAPIDRPLPTSREIQISSQRLNYVAWSVWIVLTLAVGYFVLIASYPGFGTWVDLWKRFFGGGWYADRRPTTPTTQSHVFVERSQFFNPEDLMWTGTRSGHSTSCCRQQIRG